MSPRGILFFSFGSLWPVLFEYQMKSFEKVFKAFNIEHPNVLRSRNGPFSLDFVNIARRGLTFFFIREVLVSNDQIWRQKHSRGVPGVPMEHQVFQNATFLIQHQQRCGLVHSIGYCELWPKMTFWGVPGVPNGTPGVPKHNFLNIGPRAMRFGYFDRLLWVMAENDLPRCSGRST